MRTHIKRSFPAANSRYRKRAALAAGRVDVIGLINAKNAVGYAIFIANLSVHHQAHVNVVEIDQCAVVIQRQRIDRKAVGSGFPDRQIIRAAELKIRGA